MTAELAALEMTLLQLVCYMDIMSNNALNFGLYSYTVALFSDLFRNIFSDIHGG